MQSLIKYDLRDLLAELLDSAIGVSEIYVFGSRAYGTGSNRSDCDVIVRADPAQVVKASDLLSFAMAKCPALDFFLCTDARAVSVSNDSFVYASRFDLLIVKLDAIQVWSRPDGFSDFAFPVSGNSTFEVSTAVEFVPTVLPNDHVGELSWQRKVKMVEQIGLPVRPFIGDTLIKAVTQVTEIARRMVFRRDQLGPRGNAAKGWTVNLESEYDCQNLFFTVVKPWLPDLAREEVAIRFDGQAKKSDFSLFAGKLVIEMKFIDNVGKKAEVVKTLDGLRNFYSRNANIGTLLFIIFVKQGVAIDADRWEAEYSFAATSPPCKNSRYFYPLAIPLPCFRAVLKTIGWRCIRHRRNRC